MTKEILNQLSTGDWVTNTYTNQTYMVAVIPHLNLGIVSIKEINTEDWEFKKSRNDITKEELMRIKEYHDKIKEQMKNQKKG